MAPSIARQDTAALGGRWSVLERQKRDHVELERLLVRLSESEGREQDRVLLAVYRLVFPHAFAEEAVLWPVMRRSLHDGEELTLEVEREHQEVNELVLRLDARRLDGEERRRVLDRLAQVLRDDVRDEEDSLFPRLQAVVTVGQLRLLGVLWEVVRRAAPTRAHPVVARRPPGNVLAALPLTVVDRARDLVEGSALRIPAVAAMPLERLGRALAGVALAIEHVPGLTAGEDESTRSAGRHPVAAAAGKLLAVAAVSVSAAAIIHGLESHRGSAKGRTSSAAAGLVTPLR